jgi:predicted DNA-binding protein
VPVALAASSRRRIEAVGAATGRSAEDVAREAIDSGMAAVEHGATMQAEVAAIRRGEIDTISQAELKRRLGDD